MRLAIDKQNEYARELVWRLGAAIGENLAQAILNADQKTEQGIFAQRERVQAAQGEAGRHRHRRSARPAQRWPTRW